MPSVSVAIQTDPFVILDRSVTAVCSADTFNGTNSTNTPTHSFPTFTSLEVTATARCHFPNLHSPTNTSLLSTLDISAPPRVPFALGFRTSTNTATTTTRPLDLDPDAIDGSRLLRRLAGGGSNWPWLAYLGSALSTDTVAEEAEKSRAGMKRGGRNKARDPFPHKFLLHTPRQPPPPPPTHPHGSLLSITLSLTFHGTTPELVEQEADEPDSVLWEAVKWGLEAVAKRMREKMPGAFAFGYFEFLKEKLEFASSCARSLELILLHSPLDLADQARSQFDQIELLILDSSEQNESELLRKLNRSIHLSLRSKFLALDSLKTPAHLKNELEQADRARRLLLSTTQQQQHAHINNPTSGSNEVEEEENEEWMSLDEFDSECSERDRLEHEEEEIGFTSSSSPRILADSPDFFAANHPGTTKSDDSLDLFSSSPNDKHHEKDEEQDPWIWQHSPPSHQNKQQNSLFEHDNFQFPEQAGQVEFEFGRHFSQSSTGQEELEKWWREELDVPRFGVGLGVGIGIGVQVDGGKDGELVGVGQEEEEEGMDWLSHL